MFVNITVPVYNEEVQLVESVARLHEFLTKHCRFDFEITVADNASTDGTPEQARLLTTTFPQVTVVRLEEKGRGRALKKVWLQSEADFLSYMDVDLSTDLSSFPPMIEALASGGFDVATGSRLLKPKMTQRSLKREFISRVYNAIVKCVFRTAFSDAQCGFKAITRKAAHFLLPVVEDTGWFFDTELLVLSEKQGMRIFDFPVAWEEDGDSRVNITQTALEDLKGVHRVWRHLRKGYSFRSTFTPVCQDSNHNRRETLSD